MALGVSVPDIVCDSLADCDWVTVCVDDGVGVTDGDCDSVLVAVWL